MFCVEISDAMVLTAVIFGHSYVRRMRDAIEERPRLWTGPGPRELDLHYVCRGGMRLDPAAGAVSAFAYAEEVARLRPDIIYIHLGENDLAWATAGQIIRWYFDLVETICENCHPRSVNVSQLTLFPALEQHAEISKAVNDRLERCYKLPAGPGHSLTGIHTKVWFHRIGIFGVERRRYYADDVHLNQLGIKKYCRSVSAVVGGDFNVIRTNGQWR